MVTTNPFTAIYTPFQWPASSDGTTRITYSFNSVDGNGNDDGVATAAFTASQSAAAREAFIAMERVANVDFMESGASGVGGADIALRQ
ncbi:MAG: hypothetical protein MK052_10080, partial [Alphaproteobacteria bacterium]|nr:hypothetical protein [Alphaproteobacteria bacterium]